MVTKIFCDKCGVDISNDINRLKYYCTTTSVYITSLELCVKCSDELQGLLKDWLKNK